jgi:hypothetical protein
MAYSYALSAGLKIKYRINASGKKIRKATRNQKTCVPLKPLCGASPVIERINKPKSTAIRTRASSPRIDVKTGIFYPPYVVRCADNGKGLASSIALSDEYTRDTTALVNTAGSVSIYVSPCTVLAVLFGSGSIVRTCPDHYSVSAD